MEIKGYYIEKGLTEGLHGTGKEIRFVQDVVSGIIRPAGYIGPIRLIGSRFEGKWISKSNFFDACGELPDEIQRHWYNFLDAAAHKHNYHRAQIHQLVTDLPSNAPPEIAAFLTGREPPGSDFDLLIPTRVPALATTFYYDETYGTGQHVDILILDQMNEASLHSGLY